MIAATLIAAWPSLVGATEPGATGLGGVSDIPVDEWIAMSAGRTLTYTIDGAFWAIERYYAGTDRVTLQFYDGTCLEGTWEYVEPLYCFHWEREGTSCFRHTRLGEQVLVLETRNGVETGAVQVMTGVSDTPQSCGGAPIS